jgi:hypothetical protein
MQRYNFQFTGQRFYKIEHGRLGGELRDVAYQAATTGFWNSMEVVSGPQNVRARRGRAVPAGLPPCRTSSGATVSHIKRSRTCVCFLACDNFLYERLQGHAFGAPGRPAPAKFGRGNASRSKGCPTRRGDHASAGRDRGQVADSGRAACRALTGGSPPGGSRPRSGVNDKTGVGSFETAKSSKERTYAHASPSIAYRARPRPH